MQHRLSTGVSIQCIEQGARSAPPLLLLHGYTDSWFSFSRVLEDLARDWRVIVPDQRGHGNSSRPATGYAVDDFANDVLELMDALQLPTATVAGHSMGSFVARRAAVMAAHRISRLVLIGTGTTARNAATLSLLNNVQHLSDPVDTGFIREFQAGAIYASVPPEFFKGVVAESRKLPARLWREVLEELLDARVEEDLARIECPALVIGGDRDLVFPGSDQRAAASRIRGAALEMLEPVGHSPQWEDPTNFVAILRRHLLPPSGQASAA